MKSYAKYISFLATCSGGAIQSIQSVHQLVSMCNIEYIDKYKNEMKRYMQNIYCIL